MRDHERVRAQLTAALNAMNGAADAPPGAPAPPYAPYGDYGPTGAAYAEPSPGTGAAAAAEPSLRQLVEQYAADAGVAFLPKAGRRHEGLQARMWAVMSEARVWCDGCDQAKIRLLLQGAVGKERCRYVLDAQGWTVPRRACDAGDTVAWLTPVGHRPLRSAGIWKSALDGRQEYAGVCLRRHRCMIPYPMQVYGFGGVSCVVDTVAGVVRAQLDGRWAPVSLEALLAAARLRGRSA